MSLAVSPTTDAAQGKASPPGKAEFLECGKVPPGKPVVKLSLAPEVALRDLVGFMSTISCRPFIMGKGASLDRVVRVRAPTFITSEEAYDILIAALDSVALTVRPANNFLHIEAKPAPRAP